MRERNSKIHQDLDLDDDRNYAPRFLEKPKKHRESDFVRSSDKTKKKNKAPKFDKRNYWAD